MLKAYSVSSVIVVVVVGLKQKVSLTFSITKGSDLIVRPFLSYIIKMRYRINKKGEVVASKAGEHKLQCACIRWWDLQYSQIHFLLFHIPNGGRRNVVEAAIFQRMGVRRGVCDLFLSIPAEGYHGMYIEIKFGKGKETAEQVKFATKVRELSYHHAVCDSVEMFIQQVSIYMQKTPFFRPTWQQLKMPIFANRR